jgi:phage tail protein X
VKGVVVGYGYAPLASIAQWGPTLANAISAALPSPVVARKTTTRL